MFSKKRMPWALATLYTLLMIGKIPLFLVVGLFGICLAAAEAPTDRLKAFVSLADRLARLELAAERAAANWTAMAPRFLTADGLKTPAVKSGQLRTPAKYYALPRADRMQLRKNNPKLIHLEGYFTEKEYKAQMAEIGDLFNQVVARKKSITVTELKKIIADFHNGQLDILPATLDVFIGLQYGPVENSINQIGYSTPEAIIGFDKERSQSDYADLRKIFQYLQLSESDIFYDLGSGYGRVGLYGGVVAPTVTFKGIELVRERADYAQTLARALELKNVQFIANDVLKENFDDGTVFYMFNPFPSIMNEVLAKLRKISLKRPIKIIAMGNTAVELQHTDWLMIEKDFSADRDYNPLIVYRSKP